MLGANKAAAKAILVERLARFLALSLCGCGVNMLFHLGNQQRSLYSVPLPTKSLNRPPMMKS